MAVTASCSVQQEPLGGKLWYTIVYAWATGDASGGNVSLTKSLQNYLTASDRLWIDHAIISSTNAATDDLTIAFNCSHWSGIDSNVANFYHPILAGEAAGAGGLQYQYGAGQYVAANEICKMIRMPFYLGRPKIAAPELWFYWQPNTDTKYYKALVRLLHEKN